MKALLVLALLMAGLQHGVKPPTGFYCSNHPKTPKDHQCACHPTCTIEKGGEIVMHPDPKCTVFCWEKEHCRCEHEGCETH